MNNTTLTIENIKNRIHLLEMRDSIGNQRIIQKLKRRLRNLQK